MQRNLPGRLPIVAAIWSAVIFSCAGFSQDLKSFEQRITTKVLPNGHTILICERPEAPVFSYTTFVDAGDVDDPSGESGLVTSGSLSVPPKLPSAGLAAASRVIKSDGLIGTASSRTTASSRAGGTIGRCARARRSLPPGSIVESSCRP